MLMKKSSTAQAAILLLLCFLGIFNNNLHAQVTTATLSGLVKDSKGAALVSATVTVEFPDAGISQTLITKADGRFTVPNLRVGGPYKVTVNHVSYQKEVTQDIFLELGQNNSIEFVLKEKSRELATVTVTAGATIFDN